MYKFTDDCLIGIEEIDNEHRRLFHMINEAIDLSKENICHYQKSASWLKGLRSNAFCP